MTAAHRTLQAAAEMAGILAEPAELLRDGSNILYRLPDGIVARIGRPGSSTTAEHEVRVARWLATTPVAVIEPLPEVPQPTVIDDRPVTWWHELPDHRPATPAELGATLSKFHHQAAPGTLGLAGVAPFTGFTERIEHAGWLDNEHRRWLLQHLDSLRQRWDDLPTGRRPCVVHGDAWQGNVAVPNDDGRPTLLDLEHVAVGPPEWDLAPLAVDHTDFQRISTQEYQAFVDAYGGYDVTTWPGYRTLADIQELRWVSFAISKTRTPDTATAAEAQHRIACLRGEVPLPWTWTAM